MQVCTSCMAYPLPRGLKLWRCNLWQSCVLVVQGARADRGKLRPKVHTARLGLQGLREHAHLSFLLHSSMFTIQRMVSDWALDASALASTFLRFVPLTGSVLPAQTDQALQGGV